MKKVFLMGFCFVLTITSIGCNSIRGLGEDISAVGGWLVKGSDGIRKSK